MGRFVLFSAALYLTAQYMSLISERKSRFCVILCLKKLKGLSHMKTLRPQSTIIHIEGNKCLVRVGVPKICPRDERHISWMKCYVRKVNTVLNNIS